MDRGWYVAGLKPNTERSGQVGWLSLNPVSTAVSSVYFVNLAMISCLRVFCSRGSNARLMACQLVHAIKLSELLLSFVYFWIYVLAIIASNLLFTSNSLHTYKPLFARASSQIEQVTRRIVSCLRCLYRIIKRRYETKDEKDWCGRHLSRLSLVSCFCSTLIYREPTCPIAHYFSVEISPL